MFCIFKKLHLVGSPSGGAQRFSPLELSVHYMLNTRTTMHGLLLHLHDEHVLSFSVLQQ